MEDMRITFTVEIPHVGDRIKEAIDRSELTMTQVAGLADMSVANLYRIINEETKSVPLETLQRLKSVLGIGDLGIRQAIQEQLDLID